MDMLVIKRGLKEMNGLRIIHGKEAKNRSIFNVIRYLQCKIRLNLYYGTNT